MWHLKCLSFITAAAYTYYRTKNQEQSLKQRGMYVERNRSRRRRERLLRVSIIIIMLSDTN